MKISLRTIKKLERDVIRFIICIAIYVIKHLFETHLKQWSFVNMFSLLLGILGFYGFDYLEKVEIYLYITGLTSILLLINKHKFYQYTMHNRIEPILLSFFVGNLIYPLYILIKRIMF